MHVAGRSSRGFRMRLSGCGLLLLAAASLAMPQAGYATVYDLHPSDGLNQLLTLQPGDTAILHAGTYNRIYTGTAWSGKGGSATGGWVTIKGADGEARPVINYTGGNNTFEMPSVSYMKFQNIEVSGGSESFRFTGTCKYITLDGVYMHGVSDGCVNASGIVEISNLVVRNCEIAGTPGEAFYLGKHDYPYQPQVHDSLIEKNYIHDCHEGVEIKAGCTNITVQDNVIAAGTGYPAMTIYGTYKTDNNLRYRVYRNFIFNSSDSGIQTTSDTEIVSNVIVNSQGYGIGIRSRNLDGKLQNVTVFNNTFYRAADACLQISNGDIATNLVIANNAIYQDSASATAFNAPQGIAGVVLGSNLYYGVSNATSPGLVLGATPAAVFLSASTTPGQMDLYPAVGSPLIDAADPAYVAAGPASLDFNVVARPQGNGPDIGAYEATRSVNPGWPLAAGFKTVGVPGDVTLDGHVDVVDLLYMVDAFGANKGDVLYNAACDFNSDGAVDVVDLLMMLDNFGI